AVAPRTVRRGAVYRAVFDLACEPAKRRPLAPGVVRASGDQSSRKRIVGTTGAAAEHQPAEHVVDRQDRPRPPAGRRIERVVARANPVLLDGELERVDE